MLALESLGEDAEAEAPILWPPDAKSRLIVFPVSWLFSSGGQRTGVSASPNYLTVNIVYPFP